MPAIVEHPTVVEDAVERFGRLFPNEPERRHFAEYLTGLFVAERKTVSGINSEFAVTTDQSCLNRWLNEGLRDPKALNEARLKWLQKDPSTRYSKQGAITIDNTLVDHEGKLIQDVGYFWDHADKRYLVAHDYLISNYVCTSGKHYALEFRRFRKEAHCEAKRKELEERPGGFDAAPEEEKRLAEFRNHTVLFKELVDFAVERGIPGDFAWDCYFTNAEIMNHVNAHGRGYVGDLRFNRKIWFKGRELTASELAGGIPSEDRKAVWIGETKQWYFTKTIRIPKVDHPVRIVILWDRKNGREAAKMMVTNRTYWEVTRILRVYRKRWTGTETFHRDGKQHLGMGDCQVRKGEGQTRHMYLVMLSHSLAVAEMRQGRAREWARTTLTTVGEACRAMLRETLAKTLDWALERVTVDGWEVPRVKTALSLA
jgi:hypothetical protein